MIGNAWKKLGFGKAKATRGTQRRKSAGTRDYRPSLEILEDRTVLSAFSNLAMGLQGELTALEGTVNGLLNDAARIPFLYKNANLLDAQTFVKTFEQKLDSTL